jgi:hypothetical protein
MNGDKITIDKPTDLGEIKCEIFRVRKDLTEQYSLFKEGEEEKLTKYDNEDILFCLVEIVEINEKFNVGDMAIIREKMGHCNATISFNVLKIVKRTKCYVEIMSYNYTRYAGIGMVDNNYMESKGKQYKKKIFKMENPNYEFVKFTKYKNSNLESNAFRKNIILDDLKNGIRSDEAENVIESKRLTEIVITKYGGGEVITKLN